MAPDRGEAAAAFGIFRVGIDRQGNDDRFISGMSARHQFAQYSRRSGTIQLVHRSQWGPAGQRGRGASAGEAGKS